MLVEMPHVAMGLDMSPPSREALVRVVRCAFKKHGIARACVMGHSYGTFCAAWMVQEAPDLVAQVTLTLILTLTLTLTLEAPDLFVQVRR